jgi:hypothetical protein
VSGQSKRVPEQRRQRAWRDVQLIDREHHLAGRRVSIASLPDTSVPEAVS